MDGIFATAKIVCPDCGHAEFAAIPGDRCLFFYECRGCGVILKPRRGDCCVFCSYADRPCPFTQRGDFAK